MYTLHKLNNTVVMILLLVRFMQTFIYISKHVLTLSLTLTVLFPSPEIKLFLTALSFMVHVTQHVTEIQRAKMWAKPEFTTFNQNEVFIKDSNVCGTVKEVYFGEHVQSWRTFLTFHTYIRFGTNPALLIWSLIGLVFCLILAALICHSSSCWYSWMI